VFGADSGKIPVANLANSVWVNGVAYVADITAPPPGYWKQRAQAQFGSPSFDSINSQGIFAQFTISTVGVAPGAYYLSLECEMFNGLDENVDPISVPLTRPEPILLGILVPEPSTYALAAIGGVALVAVKRRKRQVRRTSK
jgi:hypothetical protein